MFRSLAILPTLAAMLLHASLGCCWHHAHACGGECAAEREPAEGGHESHRCGCSHGKAHRQTAEAADPTSSEHGGHRHPHEGCDEGRCTYLAADLSKAPAPADGSPPNDRLPAADALATRLAAGLRGDRWRGRSPLASATSPCVRDLTQVRLL